MKLVALNNMFMKYKDKAIRLSFIARKKQDLRRFYSKTFQDKIKEARIVGSTLVRLTGVLR